MTAAASAVRDSAAGEVPAAAGATVCAGAGTVESIPATFAGCGAFMASGLPTGAYCSKASQTPMSFCAASSVSTCTRTRKGMSSIVLPGFLVSMRCERPPSRPLAEKRNWLETAPEDTLLRSTGGASRSVTAVVMGTYSEKAGGGWGPPGTRRRTRASYPPTTVPHPPVAEAKRNTRDGKTPDFATPAPRRCFCQTRWPVPSRSQCSTVLDPQGFPLPLAEVFLVGTPLGRGVMRHQQRTAKRSTHGVK